MANFGNLVQKAFYIGVGVASLAGARAGDTFKDLQQQAKKLTDELVARGEITAEEAQRMLNDMMVRAQQTAADAAQNPGAAASGEAPPAGPRRIEILDDDAQDAAITSPTAAAETAALRQQVEALRQELDRLKR